MVETGPEEQIAERMRELPIPLEVSTPKPATIITPRPLQTPHPTFTSDFERITMPHQFKSPFKTSGTVLSRRFLIIVPTPESTGPDTRREPEPSGSGKLSGWGVDVTETSSRAAWVTRSTAKQTPGGPTSFLPKRPILSSAKGFSSKRPKN